MGSLYRKKLSYLCFELCSIICFDPGFYRGIFIGMIAYVNDFWLKQNDMANAEKNKTYLSPDEKILSDLIGGRREPQNDYEKKVLEEIEEIRRKGGVVEIPGEIPSLDDDDEGR